MSSNINVLLVDDTPDALELYRTILGDLDLNLITAASGEEALGKTNDTDFAVIVLDIQMPGIDGYETAQRMREQERARQTPIIFVTGNYKDEKSAARGYALGAADYLTKPFRVDAFRTKVTAYTDLYRRTRKVMEQMRAAIPAVPKDNILVAQPELAKMLKAAGWLDKLGIEMLVCGSVKETVTALSKQEVALILVGLKLADGTGFEVAEYVRQSEQLAATPIMLVAGAGASDQDVHRGFEMGAVEVLTMPVNLDLLRAKIQSLLNQFRQIRTLKQQYGEINRLKQEVATTRQRLQDIETELDRLAGTAI